MPIARKLPPDADFITEQDINSADDSDSSEEEPVEHDPEFEERYRQFNDKMDGFQLSGLQSYYPYHPMKEIIVDIFHTHLESATQALREHLGDELMQHVHILPQTSHIVSAVWRASQETLDRINAEANGEPANEVSSRE